MRTIYKIALLYFLCVLYIGVNAQCSDAGACSIDSHVQGDYSYKLPNSISIDYSYGYSGKLDRNKYHSIRFNGDIRIDNDYLLSISIPYLYQTLGNNNCSNGLGDIIVSLDKPLNPNDPFSFSIITGVKFPTSLLDRNNFSYLNGYGTLDAIAGINCKFSNFYTSLMTQLPLTKYTDSNFEFNRGGDLIFQFAYTHRVDRVSFIVEGFMIKRLTKSEITEEINSLKKIISIPDSDFLQFNLLLGAGYKFNENLLLDLSAAFPLLKRLENSDGTKRAFSLQIGTKLFFQ